MGVKLPKPVTPPDLPWMSVEELREASPPMRWLVRNILPTGVISTLTGAHKGAGKSTLIRAMVRSVITGEPFLGRVPDVTGPTLYLTEERAGTFYIGAKRANLLGHQDTLKVITTKTLTKYTWAEVMAGTQKYALQIGAVFIIIDTLANWTLGNGVSENDASHQVDIMRPIEQLADATSAGILIVKHTRKAGGQHGSADRGSGAVGAAADNTWTMRAGSRKSTKRTLEYSGRIEDIPSKITLDYHGGLDYELISEEWGPLGDATEEEKFLAALPAKLDEVAAKTGLTIRRARELRDKLEKTGLIRADILPERGAPKVYYKT